ncbi:MAG: urate hydroxylase PuuD [Gammaproteobacteria bacterium]|nr:urate hydroxylase PuuD [Gammaproteobacteria bacterium]
MSHRLSLIAGILLALLVSALIGDHRLHLLGWARWFHIVAGVFWIGLLYYFNVAQIPALADAAADKGGPGGAGITRYVTPRALFWFRWAAVITWLTGLWYLGDSGTLRSAATLGTIDGSAYGLIIGIGGWLGTILLFNVWAVIWPNQKKVLGIVAASDAEKARARRVATLASRINFMLSIPMLLCMASASHGLPF